MDLDDYELLELTLDNGIQVSKVRQAESGQVFQIHAFHGETLAEFERLCAELGRLPRQLSKVAETSRASEVGYIRTQPLPEGVGIRGWAAILRAAPGDSEAERTYRLALQLKFRRQAARQTY